MAIRQLYSTRLAPTVKLIGVKPRIFIIIMVINISRFIIRIIKQVLFGSPEQPFIGGDPAITITIFHKTMGSIQVMSRIKRKFCESAIPVEEETVFSRSDPHFIGHRNIEAADIF